MAEYSETNYYEVQIDDIAAGGGYGDLQDYMRDMAALANTTLGNAEAAAASADRAETIADGLSDLKNGIEPAVDAWLDEHPEATTTVLDESITKSKLSPNLLVPIFVPDEYKTVDGLMDLTVSQTYGLFDAYVNEGLLTKTRVGYASSSDSGTDASPDTSKPIYMYSYRNKMMGASNYTTNSYAKPILLSNAMHGNEKMGVPIFLTMIEAYKQGKSPQITRLFDDFGIDFIPVLNPYGYDEAVGTTMETVESNIGRKNARDVDLNRNGTTCWAQTAGTDKGQAPLSECESKVIHDLATTNGNNYSFYADIHTERYNEEEHNYFGTVSSGGSLLRAIHSTVLSNLNSRMKNVYGHDMYEELNGLSIIGILNRTPMHFIDRCYALDSNAIACLYEAPRYTGGQIYPIEAQKFTCDIFINFLLNTMSFLQSYMPLYNAINRAYIKSKILQRDVLPTDKTEWEYGLVVRGTEYDHDKRIRTVNRIPVEIFTYYDCVPSYDGLYYSIDLYTEATGGVAKFINWTNAQTRINTGAFKYMRVNLSKGDPSTTSNGINMPELWHDYDLTISNTGLADADISASLSSSVATIDYARLQIVGRVAFVVLRMTMTADTAAGASIVSGLPIDINNYNGLNNVRLYNHGTQSCVDGYISHASGDTSSFLACLSGLTSGSSIRATFMYFLAE